MARAEGTRMLRVAIAALLVGLIAGAPATAAGFEDRGRGREVSSKLRFVTQDDVILLDYLDGPTGKRLMGFVDPRDGTISLQGFTIVVKRGSKGETSEIVASWAGEEIVLPDVTAAKAAPELLLPLQVLVASWAKTVDMRAVYGLHAAMYQHGVAAQAAGLLTKEASCGWELFQLAGAFLLATAACGSGVLFACVGAFIIFLSQLNDTAESCGWCGFGTPC